MRRVVLTLHVASVALVASAVAISTQWHREPVLVAEAPEPPRSMARSEREELEALRERIEVIGREQAVRTVRLDRLEEFEKQTRHEHGWLTALLVGNLAAVGAALATYIVTQRGRSREP